MRSLLLALVVVLVGCSPGVTLPASPTGSSEPSAASPSPSTEPTATLSGSIFDAPCLPFGDGTVKSRLEKGTQVTVSDGSDNVLALGRLEIDSDSTNDCNFIFTVEGVPPTEFYSIVVDSYPRLVYAQAELDGKRWHLKLALDVNGQFGPLGSD